MLRKNTLTRQTYSFSVRSLYRTSRFIQVKVLSHGREVDCFTASSEATLRATTLWTRRFLRKDDAMQFVGVEDERLPLGLRQVQREVALSSLEEALAFLDDDS